MRYAIIQAILATAAAAVLAQTLLIRELVVTFYGNELAIALMISAWLLWGAFGSRLAGRWLRQHSPRASDYVWGQLAIASALPLELLLVRAVKPLLSIPAGELADPVTMFVTSLVLLAPISLVNGFQFGLGVRIVAGQWPDDASGRVYGLEALGNLAGAAGFGYLLVYVAPSGASMVGAAAVSILSAALLARTDRRLVLSLVAGSVGALLVVTLFLIRFNNIEQATRQWAWRGLQVVSSGSSIYGNISIIRYGSMYNVYENGVLSFSFPLPLEAEEQVHLTLSQTLRHERVLVIGGGTAGALREILKYPVTEVCYLELDPNLTGRVQPLLPHDDEQALVDPRVRLWIGDARRFIKTWRGPQFDAIIINAGDPVTVFLNRFYTREFFAELSRITRRGGVVRLSITSNESYLVGALLDYDRSVYRTLKTSFPHVKAIPGDRLVLFASADSSFLSLDPDLIAGRLAGWSIQTRFISSYYLRTLLLPVERIKHIRSLMENRTPFSINEDLRPAAFYLALAAWSGHFGRWLPKILKALPAIKVHWMVLIVAAVCLWAALSRRRVMHLMMVSVGIMGFSGMAAVAIAVLGFQMVFGYVYHRVGLLSAGFMLGLFLGTYLSRYMPVRASRLAFTWILLTSAVYWLCVYLLLVWLIRATPSPLLSHLLPLLTTAQGALVGLAFVLANRVGSLDLQAHGQTSARIYAADLVGGAIAGIVITLVILPNAGISGTCLFMVLSLCITSFVTSIVPYK